MLVSACRRLSMGFNGSIMDVSHVIQHFPPAVRQMLGLSVIVRYGKNIYNSGHLCSVLTQEAKASSKIHSRCSNSLLGRASIEFCRTSTCYEESGRLSKSEPWWTSIIRMGDFPTHIGSDLAFKPSPDPFREHLYPLKSSRRNFRMVMLDMTRA